MGAGAGKETPSVEGKTAASEGTEFRTSERSDTPSVLGKEVRLSEGKEMQPGEGKERRQNEGTEQRQNEGTEQQKQHEGTANHVTTDDTANLSDAGRIPSLSSGLRKFVVTQLPHKCLSIWQSGDKLYLGEFMQGSRITVINMEGELISTVSLGEQFEYILSGIEISKTDRRHLVGVVDRQAGGHTLREVIFTHEQTNIKSNTVTNVDNFRCIFSYSSTHVGALCIRPTRVVLFKITDLSSSRSIVLDIPDGDPRSRFDVVKTEDRFYVSASHDVVVYVLDPTGQLLRTLGQLASYVFMNVPGQLRYPIRIFLESEGGLVIVGLDGAYHRYLSGQWEVLVQGKDMGDAVLYCTVVSDKVYSVYEDKLTISQIRS